MTKILISSVPPTRPPFRIANLWREEKARGVVILILVMAGFFAAIAWLIGNVMANFAALDKSFGFGFLWELPANYDINQTLIDYNSQDTHARAALVGLINTGLVAILGIVIATVLGFTLGAMRLSSNWLVAKFAYCFVDLRRALLVAVVLVLRRGLG